MQGTNTAKITFFQTKMKKIYSTTIFETFLKQNYDSLWKKGSSVSKKPLSKETRGI